MKKAVFDPNGGPIQVEINAGHAQPGAYTLILWETNSNGRVGEWKGDFDNDDDDLYTMPTPVSKNHGRKVDCHYTMTLVPPSKDYSTKLIVLQDGNTLETEAYSGQSDDQSVTVRLFLQLEKG
jgi:hypothetical protein